MGVSGQRHAPAVLPPRKENRYPLYRRLSGSQNLCGKSRPPPEFDPRTVQPVACRCTTWTIRPTNWIWFFSYNKKKHSLLDVCLYERFPLLLCKEPLKFVQAFQIHPVYCILAFDTLHVFILNTQMTVQAFWDITPVRSINLPMFRRIVIRKGLGSSRPRIVLDCLTLNSLRSGKL
jgi:hypothetical protein